MIAKILNILFPKAVEQIKRDGFFNGRETEREERRLDSVKSKNFEIDRMMKNGPVIVFCNEWQNPIIGKIVGVVSSPYEKEKHVAVVKDYLTGETVECFSTILPLTMQKLKAVAKLTPDELCSFFFEGKYSWVEVKKNPNNPYCEENIRWTNYEDWIARMKANGFFEEFPELEKTFKQ